MRQGIPQDGPKFWHDGQLGRTQRQGKKHDYRSRTITRRTCSRARGEETAGTAVRPRGSYKRREKDLGDISSKYTKVE
jgi:hypothetical protein